MEVTLLRAIKLFHPRRSYKRVNKKHAYVSLEVTALVSALRSRRTCKNVTDMVFQFTGEKKDFVVSESFSVSLFSFPQCFLHFECSV